MMVTSLPWMAIVGFLFCFQIHKVKSANILAIPVPHYSTVAEIHSVAQELFKRGHNVTFYLPTDYDTRKSITKLPIITYGKNATAIMSSIINQFNDEVFHRKINIVSKMGNMRKMSCLQVNDAEAFKKLQAEKFDFAIVNFAIFMKCLYLIPYNLKIPYASVSTAMIQLEIGHPVSTNFVPFILLPYGTEMSFSQRVHNFLYHFISTILLRHVFSPYDISSAVPKLSFPEAEDLPKMSEIFLENSDFVLDFPKPTMPNFIQVGGLTTKSPNPLPEEIKRFFDEAPHGVIVMSFGSFFKPNTRTKNLFLSLFPKLKQRVFWKNDDEKRIKNIWMQSWLPQNDALGHPNTKLIIYHCGNNGMFESLYNAVPLLCLPLAGDQLCNAKKLDHFHIGRALEITTLTEEIVLNTIRDLLEDPSYKKNISHLSKIFHSRPETPSKRAASSVEYILKYGSQHLRSNQNKLSAFQLLMGDVWLFIFAIITVVLLGIVFLFRKCLQFLCKKKNKEKIN